MAWLRDAPSARALRLSLIARAIEWRRLGACLSGRQMRRNEASFCRQNKTPAGVLSDRDGQLGRASGGRVGGANCCATRLAAEAVSVNWRKRRHLYWPGHRISAPAVHWQSQLTSERASARDGQREEDGTGAQVALVANRVTTFYFASRDLMAATKAALAAAAAAAAAMASLGGFACCACLGSSL